MNEHTKEPWHVGDTKNGAGFVYGEDGWAVAQCLQTKDKAESNASRIVACVNACAGISTEKLESKSRAGAITTLVEELVAAEKQRDELLAALKDASEEYKKLPHSLGYPLTHCNKWDELIAKVESEK